MWNRLKQLARFCASMKLGVILMVLLALGCVIGSLIPQGQTMEWYQQQYSERAASLIHGLSLDDAFHSAWFFALAMLLCCNLLLCSLKLLPACRLRWRGALDPEKLPPAADISVNVDDPSRILARLRMPKPKQTERDGKPLLLSAKNRLGFFGALISHLGVLLLIVGFTFSQAKSAEYTVYGVPGQTGAVGESGYSITIDAFDIAWSESGNAEQYTTSLTMRNNATGETQSGTASVNAPATLFGYRIYQNSTGAAAKLSVRMDGELKQEEIVCVGDGVSVLQTPLIVYLTAYEPDYFTVGDVTLPGYAYASYYMDELDKAGVQVEGDVAMSYGTVELRFSEPQNYTLLQIKQDNFALLALLGGVVTLLGMLMAFYLQPRRVWAVQTEDGWKVSGESRKGKLLFVEQFREAAGLLDTDTEPTLPDVAQEGR